MEYSVEHKVLHQEWDEATIPADEFLLHSRKFTDEDGYGEYISPTFIFEKGEVHADEMWSVKDGKVATSSNRSGVMSFEKDVGTYVEHVYYREKKLGNLIAVRIRLTDALKEILEGQS